MCRSSDRVPGSLAAAPSPITARPAISTPAFGASADRTDPAQKIPAPISKVRLRPNSSPTMPNASIAAANVSAYALTTHCSSLTPACRPTCTLPSPTLTIVLSRNVRNKIVHSTASASERPPRRAVACSAGTPTDRTIGLPRRLTGRRERRAIPAVLQGQQAAETLQAHLPGAALVHRDPGLVLQRRRAGQQDRVDDLGLSGRGDRDLVDLGGRLGRQAAPGLGRDDRGERLPVLQQADPLGHRGRRVEEGLPVAGDRARGAGG